MPYTNIMSLVMLKEDKEVPLQDTSDTYPLLTESFMHQGLLTDLHLYPTELKLTQKDQNIVIPFHPDLSFRILIKANRQAVGLELYQSTETLLLMRDFWPRAGEWEDALLKYVTRKDFH